jgi:hypothetical protein
LSLRRSLAATLLLGWAVPASASRVQWVGELPPVEQLEQVERIAGPASHLPVEELAWPIDAAAGEQARLAQAELARVAASCQVRWDAFDVELDNARSLDEAIAGLGSLHDPAGREALYRALLLQGAALYWAWSPQERERNPAAEPYLLELGAGRLLQPWVDAVALMPDRQPSLEDLPDRASFEAYLAQRATLLEQRRAEILPLELPEGATLVVDGQPVEAGQRVQLVAGLHRVHVERAGAVLTPRVLRLVPGQQVELRGLVSADDLQKAYDRVLTANLLDVPQPVKDRVELLREQAGAEPVYLAAWSGRGAPELHLLEGSEPWMVGEYERDMLVLLEASLGAGLVGSTAFEESDGTTPHGATATVLDLGAQLAWRRWAAMVELSVFDATGRAGIEYGDVATETNEIASSFARLTVAPAFYVLRLRPRRTHFVLAAPIGLFSPSHSGLGAQAWFGIPLGRTTWLRLGVDWFRGNELPKWEAIDGVNDPLTSLSLRVGVAQMLH